jgi:hypothetical protein
MRAVTRRFTYANVTATIALFIVLGGGAYAAATLPANSVGTTQLQNMSVNSAKVLDRSLLATDFKLGELPPGPAGPAGLSGLQVVYATSASGAGGTKDALAECPAGKKVTGGGSLISSGTRAAVTTSAPGATTNPTSWYVIAKEPVASASSWTVTAYAVCATVQS